MPNFKDNFLIIKPVIKKVPYRSLAFVEIILCCLSFIGCRREDNISMFKNDLQHSGIYQTRPASDTIKLKWKFKSGGYVFSSPAVSGDLVYFGSNDSSFYALDKPTGKMAWKYKTGGVISSSPAVADGVVYFVSFDGYLYALDASDGKEIWKFFGGPEKVEVNTVWNYLD